MNIVYEPLKKEDSEEFFRLVGDPRVAATMRFDCPRTLQESDRILADYMAPENRSFALRFRPGEPLWGVFSFKEADEAGTVDLSQMQTPDQWGHGYGKQVLMDMVALARKEKWYSALQCYILESNTASCRLAEKGGFCQKARHRFPGMTEDLLVYQLVL